MKKVKEYYICDRCKEELLDEPELVFAYGYNYELCNECKDMFDNYIHDLKELDKEFDRIEQKYKFGKHLPKGEDEE